MVSCGHVQIWIHMYTKVYVFYIEKYTEVPRNTALRQSKNNQSKQLQPKKKFKYILEYVSVKIALSYHKYKNCFTPLLRKDTRL